MLCYNRIIKKETKEKKGNKENEERGFQSNKTERIL